MKIGDIRARAIKNWHVSDAIGLYLTKVEKSGSFVASLSWSQFEPVEMLGDAAAWLTPEMSQHLMDRLWDCGVRPTEGKGSAGQLAATESHLKDMRRIVFDRKPGQR